MHFNDKHEVLLVQGDIILPAEEMTEEGNHWVSLKNLFLHFADPIVQDILKEYQLWNWKRRYTYCGVCGAKTLIQTDGAMQCDNCKEKFYPAQFPVVIVLVKKGEEILLAHNATFPDGLYSTLSGFVDIGETCEQAIVREVKEEVGITVKNISYFGSQNWGFSTSLMLAFTAEYESGVISVDGSEIIDAGWYSKDSLPQIPPEFSIGHQLITAAFT